MNELFVWDENCSEYPCTRTRIKMATVDSLTGYLTNNPMVTSLLQTISKFVVMGVILSCFYSFYIHFKNQLRTSTKAISALLIQGIPHWKVMLTYMGEILALMVFGLSLYLLSIPALSKVSVLYQNSELVITKTVVGGSLFSLPVMLMVALSILPLRKDIFMRLKSGSKTRISRFKLKQDNWNSVLVSKRLVTYYQSTLGFALSIALVSSMLIMAIVASYQIKNVYHPKTFGIEFDYMILGADAKQYGDTQTWTQDWAVVEREDGVSYLDVKLDEENSDYYQSSMITFYNTIEPFVKIYEGAYPPDFKETIAEIKWTKQHALVSQRHMERRNMMVYDEVKVAKPPESAYIFYLSESRFQKMGVKAYETMNTLYNNGWNVYAYRALYDHGNFTTDTIALYIVNLKEEDDGTEVEQYLKSENLEYIAYDVLMDSFQEGNDSLNSVALLILVTVLILMAVLLLINLLGLKKSVQKDHELDDRLLRRLGIAKNRVRSLGILLVLLRLLMKGVIITGIFVLLYPFYLQYLMQAFGLYALSHSIFIPILMVMAGIVYYGFDVLVL